LFELLAENSEDQQNKLFSLLAGHVYELGRDPQADFTVGWDQSLSRHHLRLTVVNEQLQVEKLSSAVNAIFFNGHETDNCLLRSGDSFVIGKTRFVLLEQSLVPYDTDTPPLREVSFEPHELQKIRFRDADKRLDVLSNLSEVIRASRTEADLNSRLVNLVLAGVPNAEAVAIVETTESGPCKIKHWSRRRETSGDFHPSSRLVNDALIKSEQSILHLWEKQTNRDQDYTAVAEFDWAFCTPVESDQASHWGLYLAGKLGNVAPEHATPTDLHLNADVKFVEIVAEIISSVQKTNFLERQQAGFRQFFAPPILEALGDNPQIDLLEPRECEVTVLFCDLRGFSMTAEESQDDLLGLLDRVSQALGIMTRQILKHGGVTGDFQGDSTLGFWGWPFASPDSALQACRAALGIRQEFEHIQQRSDHPLSHFQMGIGIAHGRAVAGKIGTTDQVKVTVFGPVVNLASRLEGMTKKLRVPILVDEKVDRLVRHTLPADETELASDIRVRKLAKVLPYGLEKPLTVSEILPAETEGTLSNDQLADYERGVDQFINGNWEEAYQLLHSMPATDRAQDFLNLIIAQNNRSAPADWDGTIRMDSK